MTVELVVKEQGQGLIFSALALFCSGGMLLSSYPDFFI